MGDFETIRFLIKQTINTHLWQSARVDFGGNYIHGVFLSNPLGMCDIIDEIVIRMYGIEIKISGAYFGMMNKLLPGKLIHPKDVVLDWFNIPINRNGSYDFRFTVRLKRLNQVMGGRTGLPKVLEDIVYGYASPSDAISYDLYSNETSSSWGEIPKPFSITYPHEVIVNIEWGASRDHIYFERGLVEKITFWFTRDGRILPVLKSASLTKNDIVQLEYDKSMAYVVDKKMNGMRVPEDEIYTMHFGKQINFSGIRMDVIFDKQKYDMDLHVIYDRGINPPAIDSCRDVP